MKDQSINDTKIIANTLPFRCVVCKGFGSVNYGQKVCKACEGKGYILVRQEEEPHGENTTT